MLLPINECRPVMHQTNSQNNLTFLKSNYKYKRRYINTINTFPAEVRTTANQLAAILPMPSSSSSSTSSASSKAIQMIMATRIRTTAATPSEPTGQERRKFSTILSLFIVIVWKYLQEQPQRLRYAAYQIATNITSTTTNTTNTTTTTPTTTIKHDSNLDETELRHQQQRATATAGAVGAVGASTATAAACNAVNNHNVSMACDQQKQQKCRQHSSSSSRDGIRSYCKTTTTRRRRRSCTTSARLKDAVEAVTTTTSTNGTKFGVPLTSHGHSWYSLMTLIIALMLRWHLVEAGTCWQTALGSGKCTQIYAPNITKSECCNAHQAFSYTDRELSKVEFFFATAIGGGVECAPCKESCENFKCGANKKCVKRKGRPKCVCAPECGAALRVRKQHQQQQSQHDLSKEELQQAHSQMNVYEKSPRDTRSLGSEITNINLGLDGARRNHKYGDHVVDGGGSTKSGSHQQRHKKKHQQSSDNQRRLPASGANQRQHFRRNKGETKHRRLLIIDSSNFEDATEATDAREPVIETEAARRLHVSPLQSHVGVWPSVLSPDWPRHRNMNSNGQNGQNGNHLTRSMPALTATLTTGANDSSTTTTTTTMTMTTTTTTTMAPTHEVTSESGNANEPTNDIHGYNSRQPNNADIAKTRVRHMHQYARRPEHAPNHESQQQQQQHDDRRQHKNNNSAHKSQRKRKNPQIQHKDHRGGFNQTVAATAKTTTTITTTSLTELSTPSNTTMSDSDSDLGLNSEHRMYDVEHGSEKNAASLSMSGHVGGSYSLSSSSSSHDLAVLNGIYEHNTPGHSSYSFSSATGLLSHTNPVCGSDGRTYNTECQLRKRACRINNSQLKVAYRGHCKTSCNGVKCLNGMCVEDQYMMPHCIACKIDCPWPDDVDSNGQPADPQTLIDAERAVCGVDGKTYRSTCDINRMICKIGRSIAVAYPGPCRADHVTCEDINCGPKNTCLVDLQTHMPRCVACRYKCPRKQHHARFHPDKICGFNNHTYNSWCEMLKDSCATGYFIGLKTTGSCAN